MPLSPLDLHSSRLFGVPASYDRLCPCSVLQVSLDANSKAPDSATAMLYEAVKPQVAELIAAVLHQHLSSSPEYLPPETVFSGGSLGWRLTCYKTNWRIPKRWEFWADGEPMEGCAFKLRFFFESE